MKMCQIYSNKSFQHDNGDTGYIKTKSIDDLSS